MSQRKDMTVNKRALPMVFIWGRHCTNHHIIYQSIFYTFFYNIFYSPIWIIVLYPFYFGYFLCERTFVQISLSHLALGHSKFVGI
jgi:hypothetical protein